MKIILILTFLFSFYSFYTFAESCPLTDYVYKQKKQFTPILATIQQNQIDLSKIFSDEKGCNKAKEKIYKYEQKIADVNSLAIEEIKALEIDFYADGFVTTGDLGILHDKKTGKIVFGKNGLPNAFSEGLKNIDLEKGINLDFILKLHKNCFDFQEKKDEPLMKSSNDMYVTVDLIPEENLSRLREIGIIIDVYKQLDDINEPTKEQIKQKTSTFYIAEKNAKKLKKMGEERKCYVFTYPDENRIKKELEKYIEKLNQMIRNKESLEKILVYAVQDFLFIHPFSDGNGRVARVLGQILYKKITGNNLIFPHEFHQEMNYSSSKLKELLKIALNSSCRDK